MATRPETARKILLYWMDGTIGLLAIAMSLLVVAALVPPARISVPHAVAAVLCLLGSSALVPFVLRAAYDNEPRPTVKLVVSGLFAAGALALLPPGPVSPSGTWEMVATLWLSAAVLYLPLWWAVCAIVATAGAVTAVVAVITGQPWQLLLISQTISSVLLPVAMWLWRWLWWTIREAHESQEAKARLAVSEERLRFARDLHDLLGHSLSVITLKSELAAKLATKDAGKAAAEMAEVRRLAGESLAEVQLAVDGYRDLDLDQELAGVRAALEAAGTRCVIDTRAEELSPSARALLAWVVREGATNVLKHSAATRCSITIDGGVLEMRNDGVVEPATGSGSGLRGLSERLATAGGTFSAQTTPGGEFLLRAAVPA
ncbi:histidine kinase [Nonomuraea sp. NPDC005983]|uniref:sensor histidine kinase n=1 Tax=Nonomuraea sp. NPDC005983 TaxID=3155595 RepID=UPI0033B2EBC7